MENKELPNTFSCLTTLIIDKAGFEGKIISPQDIALAIGITMDQYSTYSHSDTVPDKLIEKVKQNFSYFLRDIAFKKFDIDIEIPHDPRIPIQPWENNKDK